MPVLPFHKNSYNVNQIIFLNYGPYGYEYFSKYTFYVVTHVSHTNQIVHVSQTLMSWSSFSYIKEYSLDTISLLFYIFKLHLSQNTGISK